MADDYDVGGDDAVHIAAAVAAADGDDSVAIGALFGSSTFSFSPLRFQD